MKTTKYYLNVLLLISTVSFADGGVSDGGGGTTNPNPAKPEWINQVAQNHAKKILTLWLNAADAKFKSKSPAEQGTAPEKILFKNTLRTYEILKNTSVELRMSGPCFDKNGNPFDGSIYSSHSSTICISPFKMAPKLSELNYEAETIALIMHELSHLIGANESEAEAIQKLVLTSLARVDFEEVLNRLLLFGNRQAAGENPLAYQMLKIDILLNGNSTIHASDIQEIINSLININRELIGKPARLAMVKNSSLVRFNLEYLRLQIIRFGVCENDANENSQMRQLCADNITKVFQTKLEVQAKDAALRLGFSWQDSVYNNYSIRNVEAGYTNNEPVIPYEMKQVKGFLSSLVEEMHKTAQMKSNVYIQ